MSGVIGLGDPFDYSNGYIHPQKRKVAFQLRGESKVVAVVTCEESGKSTQICEVDEDHIYVRQISETRKRELIKRCAEMRQRLSSPEPKLLSSLSLEEKRRVISEISPSGTRTLSITLDDPQKTHGREVILQIDIVDLSQD